MPPGLAPFFFDTHHQKKNHRYCSDLMPKLILVSSKFSYEANFPTLNICRKSMKAQNGLKFPSELCFGIMNLTKDSYLLHSKVAFLKSGENAAGICPFFLRCKVKKISMSKMAFCVSILKSTIDFLKAHCDAKIRNSIEKPHLEMLWVIFIFA